MEELLKYSTVNQKYSSIKFVQQLALGRQFSALLFMAAIFLTACSGRVNRISGRAPDVQISPEARQLLAIVQKQNLELKTFKGTGRLTFQNAKRKNLPTRIAWVGSVPGRIRIALYGVSGQPAVSVASDGQWLYFFSHINNRFYKKHTTNKLFENYFSIPLKANDVVSVLAGRVPKIEYNYAAVESQGSKSGPVLVLKNRWKNICKKIYFEQDKQTIRRIEVFDTGGDAVYSVQYIRTQLVNGYRVPARLVFSNDADERFQLDIDRYWTDVTVSSSVFVLTPPS